MSDPAVPPTNPVRAFPQFHTFPLWRVAVRLRPTLASIPMPQQIFDYAIVATVLYLLPTALIAVGWLVLVTDLDVLAAHWLLFALLAGVLVLMARSEFIIFIELANGDLLQTTGSLVDIVSFSASLIFGPTVLWIDLVRMVIAACIAGWNASRRQGSGMWAGLSTLMQGVGRSLPAWLIGLAVYDALGGQHPPANLGAESWLAAVAAAVIAFGLDTLSVLWLVRQVNRIISTFSQPQAVGQWARLVIGMAVLNVPFPVLGALIYAAANRDLYLLFVAGVVLVNFLARTLSRAVERSTQRARELAALETLGEAIITAPPDLSTLPALLEQHLKHMFPQDRLEIRLEGAGDVPLPNGALPLAGYHWRSAPERPPLDEATWARLRESAEPVIALDHLRLAGTTLAGSGLACKIQADAPGAEGGAKEVLLGGISLLRPAANGPAHKSLPALQALASQVGSAFYRANVHRETLAAQKMSQELALAGAIQAKFLPRSIPQRAGWDVAASLVPARQTSGDFYDFIDLPGDRLGIVVADVADKGTGAALFMALSRTLIRTFALDHPDAPDEVLAHANARILADAESDQFVTVFYGVLDPATGSLLYANAGHNPGYVLRVEGEGIASGLNVLSKTGAPLGILPDLTWRRETVQIAPGEVLLLYSDGISEAQDSAWREFGEERMIRAARAACRTADCASRAHAITEGITEATAQFVGSAPQHDDMTLVVMARGE